MTHPEGLRGLHAIKGVPVAMGTAVFLVAGYFGFASGSWVSAMVVERFGLRGLAVLVVPSLLGAALIVIAKVRLAVEKDEAPQEEADAEKAPVDVVPFWPLAIAATPLVTGTLILSALLPSHLNRFGFDLKYGGLANLLFGGSSALGALAMSALAHRWGYARMSIAGILCGAPLLAAYLALSDRSWALALLVAAALCVGGVFPLLVTLSRFATGPALGRRMGIIVGGAWGIANVVLLCLGPVADNFGIGPILQLSWIFMLGTAALLWIFKAAARRPH